MSESDRSSGNQGFELDLGRLGFVIIIPVAFWAFYTTFQGLKDITRQGADDYIGIVGALVGSAAILSLMSLSSWKLGADAAALLTGRRRARGSNSGLMVLIPAFLFFLSLSAFFSFTYYHSNFFGLSSKQMEGERQPRALANIAIPLIDGVIRQAREKQVELLLKSPGALSWSNGMEALVNAAGAGGKRFESLADGAIRKAATDEADRQKTANTARDQINGIKSQLVEQQRILKAAGDIIDPQEPEITRLKAEAASADALARAAAGGLDITKKAKCGSICEGHKAKATQARSEINRIEAALKEHRDRRQIAQKKSEDLNLKLPELERVAGNNPAVAAGPSRPGPATNTPFNIKDQLAVLGKARERFLKDPTLAAVNSAGVNCKTLLATARELNAAGDVAADFDCTIRSDETKIQLEDLDRFKLNEASYYQQCGLSQTLGAQLDAISSEVRGKTIKPPEGLVKARALIQKCSDLAGTVLGRSGGLEAAATAMENFVEEQSLDRNRFTNATTHLWKFDGDARLALSVALAQDLLILIYKFLADYYKFSAEPRRLRSVGVPMDLSDNEDDPAEIRARKAMLRLARPFRRNTSQIVQDDIRREQLQDDVAANLQAMLNSLGRRDLVWQAGKGVFGIDNEALHVMENSLEQTIVRGAPKAGRATSSAESAAMPDPGSANTPSGEGSAVRSNVASGPAETSELPERRPRRSIRDFAGAVMSERASWKSNDDAGAARPLHRPEADSQPVSDGLKAESAAPTHGFDEIRKLKG